MPTTRKKVIKTVYKDEESEDDGDFSDSGSDAKFSADGESSTDEEDMDCAPSSGDEFSQKSKPTNAKNTKNFGKKPKFAKTLLTKINKQNETTDISCTPFSVKDLTEADKLLPSFLNLSESDSSDDESPKVLKKSTTSSAQNTGPDKDSISEDDVDMEYKDVWSNNIQDDSEEIAKKTFMELEKHKSKIEETKASIENYTYNINSEKESDVKDLLAMGEEVLPEVPESVQVKKKPKFKRKKDDSDSEMEDWEEVKDTKTLPQQGIQLFVEFPEAGCRKSKKVDVEMMMKRKINRVKKEYQVYMHKVHVLCWLGHGNYVSRILNDQELMAAVLSLVPSKECYPGDRVDMKYVEQITTWYKDKLTLKQDKNEDKFKPKAPPLKILLLEQIKSRVVTTRKYLVFIFVTMLRALGLQCRVMFNFVTLPLKPPSSELCSLAIKPKDEKIVNTNKLKEEKKEKQKAGSSNSKGKIKIPQVDGNYDMSFSEDENIMQIDGNDDVPSARRTRSIKRAKANETKEDNNSDNEGISPPKIAKKRTARASPKLATRKDENKNLDGNKWAHRETKTHDTIIDEKYNASAISDTKSGNRSINTKTKAKEINEDKSDNEDISRPKRAKKRTGRLSPKPVTKNDECKNIHGNKQSQSERQLHDTIEGKSDAAAISDSKSATDVRIPSKTLTRSQKLKADSSNKLSLKKDNSPDKTTANTSTRSRAPRNNKSLLTTNIHKTLNVPEICVIDANSKAISSKYFEETKASDNKICRLSRNRSQTENPVASENAGKVEGKGKVIPGKAKARTKSAPGTAVEKSKYFEGSKNNGTTPKRSARRIKEEFKAEDTQRVSHRDLIKAKKGKDDITEDLVSIIKTRIKDAKAESKKGLVKGKNKKESDEDSDYLPVEDIKRRNSESDDDFKPAKISPRPSTSRIDRRVLSSVSNDEPKKNKIDVWCEIFVEELEQWIAVDVIKGKVHSTGDLYNNATHPVCYIVGWDNNNYLKDLTRKYVPHWNTVTRKLRAEALWWDQAIRPLLGPKTARDKEEDEYLNRMQLEAPFPKSIADYKNHPLYALKRHLLKFEAIYPPDAAVLSFVRNEPVYARECVYTCRSRDTWLKEAKVVKLGEQPYKVVKARPKWDKLSNKLITDKPLEVFGPWQVQDYEPPIAENGIVPRNAYGNVELFKACMLPKGTAHIKLPGLNRVAKKLNIDCAPAMTGFDFNGGWSHPVYDGFVVCQEFEEVITEAWVKDQEEQERREKEKTEARVYGNWKKLIKGLMIRERLKYKYGFEEPSTSETSKKSKGPRLVVKKKS